MQYTHIENACSNAPLNLSTPQYAVYFEPKSQWTWTKKIFGQNLKVENFKIAKVVQQVLRSKIRM